MTPRPRFIFHLPRPGFALAMFGWLTMIMTMPVLAQTFTVIHTFTGGADGSAPVAGVTVGGSGTLYGPGFGQVIGISVVFELTHRGSGWILDPLHDMPGGYPAGPEGPLTLGPNGALYGTTNASGTGALGTVFELQPPATVCRAAFCYWNEIVLHSFQGGANDGANPAATKLLFDQAGNIYGTTKFGGSGSGEYCPSGGCGTVFELSPSAGGWTLSVLHSFNNDGIDGYEPQYGVIFDAAGNLYGTTPFGGNIEGPDGIGGGTAFELTPSGGTWAENIVYNFPVAGDDSSDPGDLIMDQLGDLYGTTFFGGDHASGTVFELTRSGGSWTFSTLYTFDNGNCYPQHLARDRAGNLYGVCAGGGAYDFGWVFKLTNSGGSWTATDLHDFNGGSDGYSPSGFVVLDNSGNVYGTAALGGLPGGCGGEGCGTVWEITP
jgi:uncharacterized repeat protein (TIGR03803 family)